MVSITVVRGVTASTSCWLDDAQTFAEHVNVLPAHGSSENYCLMNVRYVFGAGGQYRWAALYHASLCASHGHINLF